MMAALGRGRPRGRRPPPPAPRVLQGAPVPRGGRGDPRRAHERHGRRWAGSPAPCRGPPIVFLVGTLALAGVPPFSGFVSKEADPRRGLGGGPPRALRAPVRDRVPDGLLHVPRRLPHVLRGARRGRRTPRPAGRDDGPAVAAGAPVDRWARSLGGAALGLTFPEFLRGADGRGAARTARTGSRRSPSGSRSRASSSAWLVYQRRAVSAEALTRGLGPLPAWAARGYGLDALYVALYRGVVLAFGRAGGLDRPVRGRRAGQRGERRHARGRARISVGSRPAAPRTTSTA